MKLGRNINKAYGMLCMDGKETYTVSYALNFALKILIIYMKSDSQLIIDLTSDLCHNKKTKY